MPGRGLGGAEEDGGDARTGLEVEAMESGRGTGDSRIATAAWDGRVGEAEDEPRTMTWRFVDLRAVNSCEGGAGGVSMHADVVWLYRSHLLLAVIVTRFFSRSISYRSMPETH
jgi:hypothetical protein